MWGRERVEVETKLSRAKRSNVAKSLGRMKWAYIERIVVSDRCPGFYKEEGWKLRDDVAPSRIVSVLDVEGNVGIWYKTATLGCRHKIFVKEKE